MKMWQLVFSKSFIGLALIKYNDPYLWSTLHEFLYVVRGRGLTSFLCMCLSGFPAQLLFAEKFILSPTEQSWKPVENQNVILK